MDVLKRMVDETLKEMIDEFKSKIEEDKNYIIRIRGRFRCGMSAVKGVNI